MKVQSAELYLCIQLSILSLNGSFVTFTFYHNSCKDHVSFLVKSWTGRQILSIIKEIPKLILKCILNQ